MTISPSKEALEKAVDQLRIEKAEIEKKLEESERQLGQSRKLVSKEEELDVTKIARLFFDQVVPPESDASMMMDPVYGSIRLEPKLSRLVRHGVFARLDSIRQLAFVSIESANATHTRMAHSFGVARFCEMAIENFLREDKIFIVGSDKTETFNLEPDEKSDFIFLGKVCGLLHDIGHAPFGHNLDRLVSIQVPETNQAGQRVDKYFSAVYIRDYVADALSAIGIDPRMVIDIFCPSLRAKPKQTAYSKYLPIIKNVIDSDLDVDRIDFLVRDSISTGLGLAYINATALVSGMRPVVVKGGDGKRIYSVAYDERIISHVEHAIYGRHAMYDHCYETDTRLASETMLVNCMRYFLEKSSQKIIELIKYGDEDLLGHVIRYSETHSPAYNLARLLKLGKAYQTVFRQPTNREARGGSCKVVDDFVDARSNDKISDPMTIYDDWRNKIVERILSREDRWKVLVSMTPPDRYEQSGAVNLYVLRKEKGVYNTQRISEFKPRIADIVRDYTRSMPHTRVFANPMLEQRVVDSIKKSVESFFKVEKEKGETTASR